MSGANGTRTPAGSSDVLGALLSAGCPQDVLYLVAAQSALETAGWTAMWNWNLGNITTSGADYVTLPGNALHFKAYGSLSEGASDYVSYLRNRGLLGLTNLDDYVARLQAIGYAGDADYAAYQAGMSSWFRQLSGVAPTYSTLSNPWLVALLVVGTGAIAAELIREGYADDALRWVERWSGRRTG